MNPSFRPRWLAGPAAACALALAVGCSTPAAGPAASGASPAASSPATASATAGAPSATASNPAPTTSAASSSTPATGGSTAAGCEPADGATFLCGVTNVEQLVRIDGTRWAVGSSAAGGSTPLAPLYFVDLDAKTATALDPNSVTVQADTAAYPGCPGPADFANLQSLGVDYEQVNGRNLLTVVSHGGGFTLQTFDVNLDGPVPALTWIGCVLPPDEHFWPDAVATLPDGGMLATSLYDPVDPNFVAALESGQPYGTLGEWHAGSGWKTVYPNTLAGPNGVILSPDGNTAYVANWSGKRVTRIDRTTGATQSVDLPMLVDNLAWNEDGSKILAGGQTDTITQGFACSGSKDVNCNVNFAVYEIDPQTLAETSIIGPTVLGVMGGGTGALQHGNDLWLTTYRSDRIARIPYPA